MNINKIVRKLKRELGKEITVEKLSDALTKRGFSLLYIDSEEGIEQLHNLNFFEFAQTKKCFAVCSAVKVVFVDGTLHKNDIVKLLLHEIAHIDLRHIGYTDYHIINDVSDEVEADAVVYGVLNENSKKYFATIGIIISILLLNMWVTHIVTQNQNVSSNTKTTPATVTEQQVNDNSNTGTVYVTPAGLRYHREFCRYAQTEGATTLPREEAIKSYTPCKVCNP